MRSILGFDRHIAEIIYMLVTIHYRKVSKWLITPNFYRKDQFIVEIIKNFVEIQYNALILVLKIKNNLDKCQDLSIESEVLTFSWGVFKFWIAYLKIDTKYQFCITNILKDAYILIQIFG